MSNRDTTYSPPEHSNAVSKLLAKKATPFEALSQLRQENPADPKKVQEIMDAYSDALARILKKARKFKTVLFERYGGLGLPFAELMKKAKKYQKRYKFSDEEFAMFVHLAMTEQTGKYAMSIPSTKMAKTLGYEALLSATSKLNVKADEQSIVEEIINKYSETKPLHAQVLLQTLTYRDVAPEALTGEFDSKKHNPFAYIHPVIAALFLPKVKLLEDQMLLANIGYIVKQKQAGQPIQTLPDYQLYWNMITDPNDTACTINNAIGDLKNRFALQTHLWDAVLELRQGRYYYNNDKTGLIRFMQALEQCRNVIHDAPDLTYVKDEGTILRKLLSAFSLYPTYVSINRLWGTLTGAQYGIPSSPLETAGLGNITRIPMITLRLPLSLGTNNRSISLEDALNQPQWFVENKLIVPKSLSIIHSHEVLFFYVGRRYQHVNLSRLNIPYNFTNLPMTVTGWESLNEFPVNVPHSLNIMHDTYVLKSVVTVEKTRVPGGRNLITGSSAVIMRPRDILQGRYSDVSYLYDPQGAGIMIPQGQAPGTYERNRPIVWIPTETQYAAQADSIESAEHRARLRGTIFMYQKDTATQNPLFQSYE